MLYFKLGEVTIDMNEKVKYRKLIILVASTMLVIILVSNFRTWWNKSFPPPRIEEVYDLFSLGIEPFTSIESLQASSSDIIRAEIVARVSNSIDFDGDSEHLYVSYIAYQARILEVFQGTSEIGEIIEIIRYTLMRLYGSGMLMVEQRASSIPLEVGDDLVLFLPTIYDNSERPDISFQSVYYYTPKYDRIDPANWIFENVSKHNNLVLTQEDLINISNSNLYKSD